MPINNIAGVIALPPSSTVTTDTAQAAQSHRFKNIGFADFQAMAKQPNLDKYEKIGFPTSYRQGKERAIFDDILGKCGQLTSTGKTVLDIGSGCSDLPVLLLDHCTQQSHHLIFLDSQEMLDLLPDAPHVRKVAGYYPECPALINELQNQVDCILVYSVAQYIFSEGNFWKFIDTSLGLLKPSGQMLIGDIPNTSKRKRFFKSDAGRQHHKDYTQTDTEPFFSYNTIEAGQMDDAVVVAVLMRCRSQGFDAYVMPQLSHLPMANRREDILIVRP